MNHQVSDFIIRIKNASLARRRKISVPYSKTIKEIANVLVQRGFLTALEEKIRKGRKVLEAVIKFDKRRPSVSDVQVISKPSLRVYIGSGNIKEMEKKGMTTIIMSTSKGIMIGEEASKRGVGGEVLFRIW